MPTSRDMAIFVLTTTTTQPITLPLAHAYGVTILRPYMASYGLVAGLNLKLWLNQACGKENQKIETRF